MLSSRRASLANLQNVAMFSNRISPDVFVKVRKLSSVNASRFLQLQKPLGFEVLVLRNKSTNRYTLTSSYIIFIHTEVHNPLLTAGTILWMLNRPPKSNSNAWISFYGFCAQGLRGCWSPILLSPGKDRVMSWTSPQLITGPRRQTHNQSHLHWHLGQI